MPVIRVDDDVWAWLKGLAQPLEDTPNTVLRRVAGLDSEPGIELSNGAESPEDAEGRPMSLEIAKMGHRVTGARLNRVFKLGALHALYHKDGTFYESLTRFPGVLCDAGGYVRYESRDAFERDRLLNIGKKVNVQRGLWRHPRYEPYPH